MSNQEAKFILDAYRSNGRDAGDPAFASALEQAKNDPALAAWLAREQAHGAAMAAKLRAITPPPGLREAILAGGAATQRAAKGRPRRRGAMLQLMAIAAAIVVLAAVTALLWPRSSAGLDQLTAFAFDDVRHGVHGGHGAPTAALQTTLQNPAVRLSSALGVDFATLHNTGCRTLRVAGHDVLEICFVRNGAEFHCYIARVGDFARRDSLADEPSIEQAGALTAATWAKGAYRFVVVGSAGVEAVKGIL
jgi:hypothetical protein